MPTASALDVFKKAAGEEPQQPTGIDSTVSPAQPPPTSSAAAWAGGCPVVGANTGSSLDSRGADGAGGSAMYSSGGCPVVGSYEERISMPHSSNAPAPDQTKPLNTQRATSSIPIAPGDDVPAHQAGAASSKWVYPSEQMFYNAMKRKGWQAQEDDMPHIVAIHNTVNERAWKEIRRWEQLHCDTCPTPKLKRFMGRPKDFSPKARLLNLLGYKLPFDRHDWVVDRCGRDVRYVIDFYNAAPLPHMPLAMHLDVRPALDSPGSLWDRLTMQATWIRSGRWKGEHVVQRKANLQSTSETASS